ncbi:MULTISPECIES: cation:dicarboxylase symporter family transporter [unclassified Polaromonas]|uniref:dicarboxylate/amino acid:cation symporter n=1 Tax=unclassified Polaromonas TaxID=2638319 RepID=UPI000BCE2647|nr:MULTISPECIES: cation:dicarboxylase symporter family transporter [unclassified Polaromonas]OYY34391.1 MAG: sodium:dicarboxylate symporter [Polaromonas sp. 35-63-35]OYZ17891.1 MAG: sodium:dicarboxylate symporter [Polaromonas sp. 16-63-31]OYZ77290.1 MAG: sodium:dicarboxylate symporter [Polaromonas sp. 24-63-21]OZA48222.1 MAG: sodium:dicarboxylate symporter [Polaromonas sp. 17-63-33]OZA86749.1 MAG: sodium:dicarboxylate symporter [Polaromonas sp. 39-63-25]
MNLKKLYAFALNPWVVVASLSAGFALGMYMPAVGLKLGFVGDVYVDLLKMIALPFMVSAVIFSLQRLFREGGAGGLMARVAVVFVVFSIVVALLGATTLLVMKPGSNLSSETMQTFGKIVGNDLNSSDTVMSLGGVDAPVKSVSFTEVLVSLVPSNIFAALASGDTLKALVFALLFGFAVGQVPSRVSDGLTQSLETIYHSCQTLMRWLNYPLPIVLFCMSAAQMAKTGIGPLQAMAQFVLAFFVASVLALVIATIIIWKRSNSTLGQTLNALRGPFALALATRSSATCMPIMIESLADRLGFARSRVELMVPLSVSLLRIGPVIYYVAATVFIAQLYAKPIGPTELIVILSASILAGFASAGMTGLLTVSLVGLTCSYLGLPFEAAFILFLAVDPICDMLRTLVLVIGNNAAVSLICPRPLKI